MSEHTKEPWVLWSQEGPDHRHVETYSICQGPLDDDADEHRCIATVSGEDDDNAHANAQRVPAAVNFCTGSSTEHLTRATEAGVTLDSVVGVLREAEEYFDQRADAEYFPNSAAPVGNEEMTRLMEISAILAHFPNKGTDE